LSAMPPQAQSRALVLKTFGLTIASMQTQQ